MAIRNWKIQIQHAKCVVGYYRTTFSIIHTAARDQKYTKWVDEKIKRLFMIKGNNILTKKVQMGKDKEQTKNESRITERIK